MATKLTIIEAIADIGPRDCAVESADYFDRRPGEWHFAP